jgi:hypothetical protein
MTDCTRVPVNMGMTLEELLEIVTQRFVDDRTPNKKQADVCFELEIEAHGDHELEPSMILAEFNISLKRKE